MKNQIHWSKAPVFPKLCRHVDDFQNHYPLSTLDMSNCPNRAKYHLKLMAPYEFHPNFILFYDSPVSRIKYIHRKDLMQKRTCQFSMKNHIHWSKAPLFPKLCRNVHDFQNHYPLSTLDMSNCPHQAKYHLKLMAPY